MCGCTLASKQVGSSIDCRLGAVEVTRPYAVLHAPFCCQQRTASEATLERGRLSDLVQALQRQQSLLEVELVGMQEQMRGVLDLSRGQQAELNARVDGLTHRISSALTTGAGAPASAASGGSAPSLPSQAQVGQHT